MQRIHAIMGHFGHSGFDTDEGMDWLAGFAGRYNASRISRALSKYERFNEDTSEKNLSREYAESIAQSVIASHRKSPPRAWRESGMPLEEWLQQRASEIRHHYESGAYLDEQYGPVEEAFAAAEMVASIAGRPPANVPKSALEIIRAATGEQVAPALLARAVRVVEKIRGSSKYQRMRSEYLSAFPQYSGGDDSMNGIDDLLARLRQARGG